MDKHPKHAPSNTLFLGKVLMEYQRLDSTNSEAERLLRGGSVAEGTVILAHEQFAGRGQMGNVWHAGKGEDLAISLILYPKISPKEQFLLNQVISLGIHDALENLNFEGLAIKWPNDILVKHRKVAGILIQNSISSHKINHSIVGVGLNVNSLRFPKEVPKATSLSLEAGRVFSLYQLLDRLCQCWEARYLKSKQDVVCIQEEYHQRLYRLGEVASYQVPGERPFAGIIRGVGADGMLQLDTEGGMKSYAFKQVAYLG